MHTQLDHIFDAHAPPFAMRRAFGFAVFHSFSVELRLDAGLSGVDRPHAFPLATSVPSWTSHQTTVMVIGFGHDRRTEVGVGRGAPMSSTSTMHAQLGQSQQHVCTAEN